MAPAMPGGGGGGSLLSDAQQGGVGGTWAQALSGHPLFLPGQVTRCYFTDGYLDTCVYLLEDLSWDHSIPGPSIIIDKNR